MIQHSSESGQFCSITKYTPAWALGTGLRVSVAPGTYPVTCEQTFDGICYLTLGEAFRVRKGDVTGQIDASKV